MAESINYNSKRNQYYQYSDCRCMERKKLRKMPVRLSLLGFNQIAPAGTVKAWQREMSFKYVRARAWDGSIVR